MLSIASLIDNASAHKLSPVSTLIHHSHALKMSDKSTLKMNANHALVHHWRVFESLIMSLFDGHTLKIF